MKNKNLKKRPTKDELLNAGFVKARQTSVKEVIYSYHKEIVPGLIVEHYINGATRLCSKIGNVAKPIKSINGSKESINKEFEHFKQSPPDWVSNYSYEVLKKKGKIPHGKSGENHDSAIAYAKILDIVELLNEEFTSDDANFLHYWHISPKMEVCQRFFPDQFCFGIHSKEAAQLFLRDNAELINQFYKNKP